MTIDQWYAWLFLTYLMCWIAVIILPHKKRPALGEEKGYE
nr:MAG TPA_asm: hypothetical protein [Caudoviricetes sp.]